MITLTCPNPKCHHNNVIGAKLEDIANDAGKSTFTCDNCEQKYAAMTLFGKILTRPAVVKDDEEDDCQCLICTLRRGERVPDPDEDDQPQPNMVRVMIDILRSLRAMREVGETDINEGKSVDFSELHKTHGDMMLELFPEGVSLDTAESINRYTLVSAIAGSLSRYASHFNEGGHVESLREIKAYAAMLEELDLEEGDDG